jgi:hypothetical protein
MIAKENFLLLIKVNFIKQNTFNQTYEAVIMHFNALQFSIIYLRMKIEIYIRIYKF